MIPAQSGFTGEFNPVYLKLQGCVGAKMQVGIAAKLKNGILWEAAKKAGSAAALARHLGISPSRMGDWLHFNGCPDFDNPRLKDKYFEIDLKLVELTGCGLDVIFPPEIRNKSFLNRQKKIEAVIEMPIERLVSAGAMPKLLAAPDELLFEQDRQAIINHIVSDLKERHQKVIKMRFGLHPYGEAHTHREIGKELGISAGRVRQIENNALRKLRHPKRSCQLKQVLDG
jgi:RNA polymerase sigma factor (sigma-70 family)